jgi:hypothetical protein
MRNCSLTLNCCRCSQTPIEQIKIFLIAILTVAKGRENKTKKQKLCLIDLISPKSQVFDSTDISQYISFVEYFDLLLDETK